MTNTSENMDLAAGLEAITAGDSILCLSTITPQIHDVLNSEPRTSPPKKFTNFGELPTELRFQIWQYAAEFPQTVGVKASKISMFALLAVGTPACCPLIHTCKEARDEVQRTKENICGDLPQASKIYSNLSVDTIWLQGDSFLFEQLLTSISKRPEGLRRLAVNAVDWDRYEAANYFLFQRLGVREIIVVVEAEDIDENNQAVFVKPRKQHPQSWEWHAAIEMNHLERRSEAIARRHPDERKMYPNFEARPKSNTWMLFDRPACRAC